MTNTAPPDIRGVKYREQPTNPQDLLRLLFEQEQPYLTVECQTITDCDRKLYEPVFKAIGLLKSWNAWDGKKVERFLRNNLCDGHKGPIIAVRFGREYSPVLYLTLTAFERVDEHDYRRLTLAEQDKLAKDFAEKIKRELDADNVQITSYSPGIIRAWWD